MKAAPGDGPAEVVAKGSGATRRLYLEEPVLAKELLRRSLIQERQAGQVWTKASLKRVDGQDDVVAVEEVRYVLAAAPEHLFE